jgi:hypothetical protein
MRGLALRCGTRLEVKAVALTDNYVERELAKVKQKRGDACLGSRQAKGMPADDSESAEGGMFTAGHGMNDDN